MPGGLSFCSAAQNVIGFYLASPHVRIIPPKGNIVPLYSCIRMQRIFFAHEVVHLMERASSKSSLFGISSERKKSEIKICPHFFRALSFEATYLEGTFPVYFERFLRALFSSLVPGINKFPKF